MPGTLTMGAEKVYETIILGGGAAGLMTAAQLDDPSAALLIEGNAQLGAKLLVSGGGKCNITNVSVSPEDYVSDAAFVTSALRAFGSEALIAWLRQRGLEPVIRKEGQYFCPESARQIVALLEKASREIARKTSCKILGIERMESGWRVKTSCGRFETKRVVVATGGISFPRLGATDIGYRIAESVGHTIVPPRPALVGLTLQREQAFFKELSGLSTSVEITVAEKTISGNLLFAHKGISGPAVLDASLFWQKGRITIDWVPGFDWEMFRGSKKQISTLLPVPRRMAKAFLKHLEIEDKAAKQLHSDEIARLRSLNAYEMAPAGTFGYSKAEVTRGGVSVAEIDPETMESTLARGLYFVGEVLDVASRLGGYNLQWAFSSSFVCSRACSRRKNPLH